MDDHARRARAKAVISSLPLRATVGIVAQTGGTLTPGAGPGPGAAATGVPSPPPPPPHRAAANAAVVAARVRRKPRRFALNNFLEIAVLFILGPHYAWRAFPGGEAYERASAVSHA
mgnify:CR=1 FL=1